MYQNVARTTGFFPVSFPDQGFISVATAIADLHQAIYIAAGAIYHGILYLISSYS